MEKVFQRTLITVTLAILLACCPFAFALDPSLGVSQYAHTVWKVREGFVKGEISAITQSPDGYIWLGTDFGLLRFDGIKTVPLELPQDQHLPANMIFSLLAARDGTLWIGTSRGLASWKGGKLSEYPELAGQVVHALVEDREGTIWVGSQGVPPPGRLCAIRKDEVRCSGADGSLHAGVYNLYEDSRGSLWVATDSELWRWKPGKTQYHPPAAEVSGWLPGLAEDSDGAILICTRNGIRRLVDGRVEAYPLPGTLQHFGAHRLLRDRDGSLWIGTTDRGIIHVHSGKTDVFGSPSSLSGNYITDLFEDREGNIWVATRDGLDRFRNFAVVTLTVTQGLSHAGVQSILADRSGNIWLSTPTRLDTWSNGKIEAYNKSDGKLDGLAPNTVFKDSGGQIWVSTGRNLGYLDHDRFVALNALPRGYVSLAEDSTGNLWVATQGRGLMSLHAGRVVQQISWDRFGHKDFATALVADRHGGLWLGFWNGGISYFAEGQIRASYTTADGLGAGRVSDFRIDPDGTLWASTEGGLSRLRNGRTATLSSKNGLPCDTIHWFIEDDDRSLWLYMPCGLVRIARSEMDDWIAAADRDQNTKRAVRVKVFDSSDGVRTVSTMGLGAQAAKTPDGRLWFLPWDGVSVVDPKHLPFNNLPPPVHIEQITADGQKHDANSGLLLPPRVRDLTIDYTALSLVQPEKIHFRYKLEGQDPDWREVVNDREVQYSNLPPRHYRFRVTACNNSGVWNEQGDTLEFSIAPAYYQTNWFRSLCSLAFLGMLWGLYQLRLFQLAQQFNMRLETRVNERTRIARELHDTLLQSFHGLLFRFQAARNMLPRRPEAASEALDSALSKAEQAIAEGRSAIQDLRSAIGTHSDLAQSLTAAGRELAAQNGNNPAPVFRVIVEGEPRKLSPALKDELYRMGHELLQNAFQHARAQEIEAEIRYDRRMFRLLIRDNGKGIDPKVLEQGGRPGHWGLPGLRERAHQIGAQLDFWSEVGAGTEIQLAVPVNMADQKSADGSGFRLFRKVKSKE